jgi:hypothetical protein
MRLLCSFIVLFVGCVLFGGCVRVPKIRVGKHTVTAPKDVGKPATLSTAEAGEVATLPAGSKVTITETAAQPAVPASAEAPAAAATPARRVTEFVPSAPMEWHRTESSVHADTGSVDTTVATKRIEAEERRPLLYCAIVAAVAGLGFMYVRFQSIAVMCFIGSGCFFLAWRMAEISPWVGGLFLVAAVAGFAFYKRAEWDQNGDGIPDALQRGKNSS